MDAIEQLKQDVRDGRVGLERLIDVIVTQQRQLEAAQRQLLAAKQRIEELEKKPAACARASTRREARLRESRGRCVRPI